MVQKTRPAVSDKGLARRAAAAERKVVRMKERKRQKSERKRIEKERGRLFGITFSNMSEVIADLEERK